MGDLLPTCGMSHNICQPRKKHKINIEEKISKPKKGQFGIKQSISKK